MAQEQQAQRKRRSVPRLVRQTHLFMALFLMPWIAMYALSTIAMHHRQFWTGHEHRVEPDFDTVREITPYVPPTTAGSPGDIAGHIVRDVGLDGAYSVRGSLESGSLSILRNRPLGSYRLTYDTAAGSLRVEKQQFGLAYFLEMLHRRRGYAEDYVANDLWALIVDSVLVAIALWGLTGVWLWLGMSRTRKAGSLCAASGFVLFSRRLWVL